MYIYIHIHTYKYMYMYIFFLSFLVAKNQPHHWTKRVVNTRLTRRTQETLSEPT